MKVYFKSFKEVVEHVVSTLSEDVIKVFACTGFKVWKRRNIFVFEGKFENPSRVALSALNLSKDLKEANDSNTEMDHGRQLESGPWRPPPLNVYKANWDASIDRASSRMGIGVVVTNWEGRVMATLRSSRKLVPDAKLAEAVAALRAVLFCKQLGISRLLLEGDALNVVNDLNREEVDWSAKGMIIQDIKSELK
ncbi:hypothetical protein F2P56_012925 [Juglans regia]|uniref:RNase H type-1 domain-containing protein n=2 Tax=Juglans regia TaxID=51240 RepID=A0A834CV27_JUGRE|nr:uncharacterized protein LOC109000545 [Juglans regia]KAF5468805.1 hypothetical protein F2P56_012925 [Juglans regia]